MRAPVGGRELVGRAKPLPQGAVPGTTYLAGRRPDKARHHLGGAEAERAGHAGVYREVPSCDEVAGLASRLRADWLGVGQRGRLDIGRICERLGVEVELAELGSARHGPQALLIPNPGGGFLVRVDPRPRSGWSTLAASQRRTLARHRARFAIMHELAHTLFYERGLGEPRRGLGDSDAQENFCDELARALLVPPTVAARLPLRPQSAHRLHKRFDVSLELATRALISAHGERAAGWLMIVRPGARPELQWSSSASRFADRPARVLESLARRLSISDRGIEAEMRWRNGKRSPLIALYLSRRGQLLATASAPTS